MRYKGYVYSGGVVTAPSLPGGVLRRHPMTEQEFKDWVDLKIQQGRLVDLSVREPA